MAWTKALFTVSSAPTIVPPMQRRTASSSSSQRPPVSSDASRASTLALGLAADGWARALAIRPSR
jgi:hypothetical protein